jgi:hypothetical protein
MTVNCCRKQDNGQELTLAHTKPRCPCLVYPSGDDNHIVLGVLTSGHDPSSSKSKKETKVELTILLGSCTPTPGIRQENQGNLHPMELDRK